MKTFGFVILLLGIIMTTVTGFTIITRKESVELGPVEVQMRGDRTPIYWSPIAGAALIVSGAAFVIASRGRKWRGR